MKILRLDANAEAALASALSSYLDGYGMGDSDEDEPVLQGILDDLEGGER